MWSIINVIISLVSSSGAGNYPTIKMKWFSYSSFPILSYYEGKISLFVVQAHSLQPLMVRSHLSLFPFRTQSLPALAWWTAIELLFCPSPQQELWRVELSSDASCRSGSLFHVFLCDIWCFVHCCSSLKCLDFLALHPSNSFLTFLTPCFLGASFVFFEM